ncbi:MAG TPA: DUF502 domain-containing protein [Pirellulales bacterium]|nr:DUF502 domain-containing protein [Pirellulales bacterium]
MLRGLGVLLPPLLTIVILVWIWQTVKAYVLEPVSIEARNILALKIADVRNNLPSDAKPGDEPGVFVVDSVRYRQLDNGGQYIPLDVYRKVKRGIGSAAEPETGIGYYRRYVEMVYLRPVFVIPAFLLVFVSLMYLLGVLFAAGVGRALWVQLEHAVERLPVVRSVYNAAKQVTDYMFTEKQLDFKRVIAFEHPSLGQWQIGFVASEGLREVRELAGEPVLAVLVHVNPVPVSGYVRLVPKSQVLDLDMTVDQAVHYIISFGVVLPPQQIAQLKRA